MTGIDYARLIDRAHQAELAQGVNYAALARSCNDQLPGEQLPGQLDLLTGQPVDAADTDTTDTDTTAADTTAADNGMHAASGEASGVRA